MSEVASDNYRWVTETNKTKSEEKYELLFTVLIILLGIIGELIARARSLLIVENIGDLA